MKKYLAYASIVLSVLLARLMPFHWIVGSWSSWFSWSTMMAPIVSKYAGLGWLALFLVPIKGIHGLTLFMFVVRRLPLLGASLAYKQQHVMSWVVLPIICMTLFVIHPIGSQAWPYAMYWCIPIILWFISDTIWSRALGASFVAHAIGSVIWLYTGNIPAHLWYGLIPVVIVERLCMASGMVVLDAVMVYYRMICSETMLRLRMIGWL